MARFTVPEKWNDEWFSNLKPIEKLVFLYLVDRCDNAGFFEINKRIDAFLIGISQDEFSNALTLLEKAYVTSINGRKIWIKNYLLYQKNLPLNPDNNAHKQIINFIKSNLENFNYEFDYLGAKEGLIRGLGKGKGKGKVIDGGVGEEKEQPEPVYKFPLQKIYDKTWDEYRTGLNGQANQLSEIIFIKWKEFVDFIWNNNFQEIFVAKFVSPIDFGKLITDNKFLPDKWKPTIEAILASGIEPKHNLFYRIPQFIKITEKNNKHGQPVSTVGKTFESDKL